MKIYTIKDYDKIIFGYLSEKVIIVPTDTIYGITCIISSQKAKSKIFKIKYRSKKMYLSVIVSSIKMINNFIDLTYKDLIFFKKNKDITIIGNVKKNINNFYNFSENNTIGIRLTKSKWLKKIINKVGPIYATSVNINGQIYAKELNDLKKFNVDIIVYNGYLDNYPSKIYNCLIKKFIR